MRSGEKNAWRRRVEAVGAAVRREDLDPEATAWLESAGAGRWALACSGGLDSVALLLLMEAHFGPVGKRVTLLHFNHRLRGDDSDEDSRFVAALAGVFGCAFLSATWDDAPEVVSEAAARTARWRFFDEVCAASGLGSILLGHHLDDLAELLLMRVGRGSGSRGLGALRPVQPMPRGLTRVRPLLSLDRASLEAAMRAAGVPWREDATNQKRDFTRNRFRLDVLPGWKRALPQDWGRGVRRTRRLCAEDSDALEALAESARKHIVLQPHQLDGKALRQLSRAVSRRIVERWVRGLEGLSQLSAAAVDAVVDRSLRTKAGAMDLGQWHLTFGDEIIARSSGVVVIEKWRATVVDRATRWQVLCPPDGVLSGEPIPVTDELCVRLQSGQVDPAHEVYLAVPADGPLLIRRWAPGDRYRPMGAKGSRKLQDAFVDRHIPVERRGILPVVALADGTILWVPGLVPAECGRVLRLSPTALKLTYHPRLTRFE